LSVQGWEHGYWRRKRLFPMSFPRFSPQNFMPAALVCRREKLAPASNETVDKGYRGAAAGILIAWQEPADGGRVHHRGANRFGST
jgi:hypothetical protein